MRKPISYEKKKLLKIFSYKELVYSFNLGHYNRLDEVGCCKAIILEQERPTRFISVLNKFQASLYKLFQNQCAYV